MNCTASPVKCHLDFETRGVVDLKRVGLYRYVEDPNTSIWLFCYRFDNDMVREWRPGWPAPTELLEHIVRGGIVVAHNAAFERHVWNAVIRRLPGAGGWPGLSIGQMDCTMARALAIHLPGDLDTLGEVLGTKQQKDKEGHRLMMQMAKPRRSKKGDLVWWDEPEKIDRLSLYCQQDVLTECDIDARLPPLSSDERALWELDQRINDRGIAIDVVGIEKIVAVLDVATERANARMKELTGGAVSKVTEAAKLVMWLQSKGLPVESVAKAEKDGILDWCGAIGTEAMEEAVRLRYEVGKNSTAKFRRMLEAVCDDGRLRGLLRYHSASTGRWGGQMVQPQNLPRVDEEKELPDVLGALEILNAHAK